MLNFAAPNNNDFLCKRFYNEPISSDILVRENFQRDRDRIVHSRAFRRLMHKTQVFNANKGDHYRNRLTHTLEVNQIARSIGKGLGLNDELIEAISLGHDLGHTPFGHVGERTLHLILQGEAFNDTDIKICGKQGFKHNFQSIQIIDNIETTSSKYNGMNLTLAVREGIIKHTGTTMKINLQKNNISKTNVEYSCLNLQDINLNNPSFTLEGQTVAIADEIAQCTHDLEDAIRADIITLEDLKDIKLVKTIAKEKQINLDELHTTVEARNMLIKFMVGYLIDNVYSTSLLRLENEFKTSDDIPKFTCTNDVYKKSYVEFESEIKKQVDTLTDFKLQCILSSQIISQSDAKAEHLIKQLYKAYYKHPLQLPDYILNRYYKKGVEMNRLEIKNDIINLQSDVDFQRLICDHIACMTDQYVEREYKMLYMPDYV